MSDQQLGPLVRLWGVETAQLPGPTASPDDLAPFLISILQEAVPFIDSVAPKNAALGAGPTKAWKAKGAKSFPESAAKVEVLERIVPAPELELIVARNQLPYGQDHKIAAETWACRRSVHLDAAKRGTANWAEFVKSFKDLHAQTEEAFTPNIVALKEAISWNCGAVESEEGGERWRDFSLKVIESRHKVGAPLKNRVFPVLQMTASAKASKEFLVVSITVTDFADSPQAELSKDKSVVVGAYTSIERIRKLPESGEIEWIMATASDARGVLPMWVQTKAVIGLVAKDVQLFLTWIASERDRSRKREAGEDSSKKEGTSAIVKTKKDKDVAPSVPETNEVGGPIAEAENTDKQKDSKEEVALDDQQPGLAK